MGRCRGCGSWSSVEEVDVAAEAAPAAPEALAGRPLDGLDLRDWQVAAFAAWTAAGCRGVVEAITGAGKTRLAVAAVRATLWQGGRALVLAPTLELQDQWVKALRREVPGCRPGRLGGGGEGDLDTHRVVVATPHSAAAYPVDPPGDGPALLVADEAHRYGSETWRCALRPTFQLRLALTATYERSDDGVADVLGPYFGRVVHTYGYAEAARDGVIAPLRVALVHTDLEQAEREAWDRADAAARRARRVLVATHGFPRDPRRTLAAATELVASADAGGRARDAADVVAAREYLWNLRARRDVAATAAGKLTVLRSIAPALHGRRTLVFCDTVAQAELACRAVVRGGGPLAETLHGELAADRRRARLVAFSHNRLPVLAAPRVLDEGVDLPDADVAVVLATFRSRRQLVQRVGRILRCKADGREARLVLVYARDTLEDPHRGAHGEFLADVTPATRSIDTLDGDTAPSAVAAWLGVPPR